MQTVEVSSPWWPLFFKIPQVGWKNVIFLLGVKIKCDQFLSILWPFTHLKSAYISPILFSNHFLMCWYGEFFEQSRSFLVGDHLLYNSRELHVWFSGDIVRHWIPVTLRCQKVNSTQPSYYTKRMPALEKLNDITSQLYFILSSSWLLSKHVLESEFLNSCRCCFAKQLPR